MLYLGDCVKTGGMMKHIGEPIRIICSPGVQISAYIREKGFTIATPCGSRGNCGKCRIKVVEGELPINPMDRVQLSEEELSQGIRLACQTFPAKEVVIELD